MLSTNRDTNNEKWGKYRALVVDINDPEKRGRIKVKCPAIFGTSISGWCEVCLPTVTEDRIDFQVPSVDSQVWIEFERGDVNKPVYSGSWVITDQIPSDLNVSERLTQYGRFREHYNPQDSSLTFDFRNDDNVFYKWTINGMSIHFDGKEGYNFLKYGSANDFTGSGYGNTGLIESEFTISYSQYNYMTYSTRGFTVVLDEFVNMTFGSNGQEGTLSFNLQLEETKFINYDITDGFIMQQDETNHLKYHEEDGFVITNDETKVFSYDKTNDFKIDLNGKLLEYKEETGFKITLDDKTLDFNNDGTFEINLNGDTISFDNTEFEVNVQGHVIRLSADQFRANSNGNMLTLSNSGVSIIAGGSNIQSSGGSMTINGRTVAFTDQLHTH